MLVGEHSRVMLVSFIQLKSDLFPVKVLNLNHTHVPLSIGIDNIFALACEYFISNNERTNLALSRRMNKVDIFMLFSCKRIC